MIDTTVDIKNFYDTNYKPLTPYGQETAKKMLFIADKETLEKEYQLIEQTIKFIERYPIVADKIEFYLKKIPFLYSLDILDFDSSDLFLIKKFLVNYFDITQELKRIPAHIFDISFSSKKLLEALCVDQEEADSFYLNDKYSEKLESVRKKIKKIDKELEAIKQEQLSKILEKFKLDFKLRDFLVINENAAVMLDKKYFFIEPFDSKNFIVKPIYSEKYFALYLERDRLVIEEQKQENVILGKLSKQVLSEKNKIIEYIKAVTKLDILISKSRLAIKYGMTKPVIKPAGNSVKLKNGRYIPLVDKCNVLGTKYYPLTSKFSNNIIVVTGSNMGGKTILLQTICFMQTFAQMGFFVPADLYETVIFDNIYYIGETRKEDVNGLSSFGLEIYEFMKAYGHLKGKTLFIIDEFAKATNSREAIALLSAILKTFSENSDIYMFLSTHFLELPKLKNTSFYKMKGLDYSGYEKYYTKERDYSLDERIRFINRYMRYEVIPDDSIVKQYDALNVANILGFDKKILSYAKEYMACMREKKDDSK